MAAIKNKRQLFLAAILCVAAWSCSSDPKSSGNSSASKSESTQANSEKSQAKPSEETVETPKISAPQATDNLLDAIKSGSDEKITTAARTVLGVNPNDARALNALAVLSIKQSNFQVAKVLLTKALVQSEQSAELWNNMGIVQLALGEDREALKSLRKAFELNGQEPNIAANLGAQFLDGRDYKKALFALEIAEKRPTKDWKAYNNLGIYAAYKGRFSQSQKYYDEALKLSPSNKEVLYNLAVLAINHQNKPNDGLEHIQRLKFLGISGELKNKVNALETRAKMR